MIVEGSKLRGLTTLADNRGIASLPILQDMDVWWREWGPRIVKDVGKQGWVLFILDANEKIMETSTLLSRVLRNKPEWDTRGWTEKEWSRVDESTTAAVRWFENNMPKPEHVPEWAQFILSAQYANLCVLARLGRETQAAIDQGYTTVVLEADEGRLNVAQGGHKFLTEVA